MKKTLPFIISLFILLLQYSQISAINPMEKRMSVSGYIKDATTGEALVGASVFVKEIKNGAMTNLYGFYSINLIAGTYNLEFKYVGFKTITKTVNVQNSTTLNIELIEETQQINEVVIKSGKADDNVKKAEMSVTKLEMKQIKQIPAFMGEVDIIKAIQMLPGVQSTSEGTSGFSVRGGGIDQNLIILDEATVYNASHLMGFFSVFNNDAIRDVKLYKGDIPSNYGGRLSSVLDVRMKEGNMKKFCVTGGVGILSSRLTVEGPIIKNKTSFLVSGRRTYYDIFFPLFPDTGLQKSTLYFYDLNMKLNHEINNNNRVYLSAYLGRDNMGQKGLSNMGLGNQTLTLRWNHLFSSVLFSNITLTRAKYDYKLFMEQSEQSYNWNSSLLDNSFKIDFTLYPDPKNEVRFGVGSTYHTIKPCEAWIEGSVKAYDLVLNYPDNHEIESFVYISNQQKIGDNLSLKYGLRYTLFQNIGETTIYNFDKNYKYVDSSHYKGGKIFNTFDGLDNIEPRLGIAYNLTENASLKASYSRTLQFMQLASNSTGGMPLDIWFPSGPNVKPQKATQYALGYFHNINDNSIETSVEVYYKNMNDVVDFKDHPQLLMNPKMEGEIRTGKAQSYGAEFLLRKNDGRLNGWISYTYSRVKRKIKEINDGKYYSAPYDKPNNINIILNYEFSDRIVFSTNWIYATGAPYTSVVGTFSSGIPVNLNGSLKEQESTGGNTINKIYSSRNGSRMRDYHRLDLSLTIKEKKVAGRNFHWDLVFSIYNAYGRHNDWILNFSQETKNNENRDRTIATRWYLPFVYFPGITFNFSF